MATVVEVLAKLKADTGQFTREMNGAAGQLQKASASMSKVGGSLTRSVTLPLVGIGTAAVFTATQFESSMSKIVGLVGIAADEVDGMRDSVLALSGETAKGPQELADALFVITSAGLRGDDALSALERAAKASAAGLGETTDIARALSGAMNAYGSDVLNAAEATDVIVATARAGNFETSQFAAAIGNILPSAVEAGASLADLGGAVALLTRTNGDAAKSATQVTALFRGFATPTMQAQKAFQEMGLSAAYFRDIIRTQGLPAAIQELDNALGGNRERLQQVLGSSEAVNAALGILNADSETLAATFGDVNKAAGITDEAFLTVAETTGFKLQRAMATFKTVLIEIGDILLPLVQRVADFSVRMMAAFQGLPDEVQGLVVALAGVAAAIGPALLIFAKLAGAASTVAGLMGGGAGLAGVLGALTGPVGLVIAAIAGLVAIVVAMWRESEIFRDAVGAAFNTVKDAVMGAVGTIRGALEDNAGAVDTLRMVFKALGDFVGSVILPLWSNYLAVVIKVVSNLIAGWIRYMGFLIQAFRTALPYVLNFAADVISGFGQMVDFVLAGIENMLSMFATIAGFVGLDGPLNDARDAVAGFRDSVRNGMQTAERAMRDAATATEASASTSVDALDDYRDAAVRARGATDEYRDSIVRYSGPLNTVMSDTEVLAGVTDAAAAATIALSDAFSALSGFLSETAAMDRAYQLLQDFQTQVSSNTAGFDGYSDAAMANRDAFGQWAQAQITAAESLQDPEARLAALVDIQQTAADALLSQGFTPEESEYYQSIAGLVDAAETEVAALGDAVTTAKESGLDVAAAVAAGITQGMSQQTAAINGAGLLAGDEVSDGLNTALGISSPSRIAAEAGRNTGMGLVQGLTDFNLSIANGGNLAGQALINGMIAGLDARSGALYSRIRSIIAAAIAAANSAARSGGGSAPPPPTGAAASGTGAATTRAQPTSIMVNVQAAPGEAAASSVPRALRRASWVGGLDG